MAQSLLNVIFYIIPLVLNASLAVFIYAKNRKNKINIIFSVFILSVIGWLTTLYLFYNITNPGIVLFLGRFNFVFATLSALLLFYFVYVFPKKTFSLASWQNILINGSAAALILLTLFTPLIDKAEIVSDSSRETVYGALYPLFIIHFVLFFIFSVAILVSKLKAVSKIEKIQIKYFIYGFILTAFSVLITNVIFPLFKYYDIQNFGPLTTLFFISLTTYAIFKHHLLNIRIIFVELLVAFLLIILFISIFFSETFFELVAGITLFILVSFFGFFLIRSVLKEIKDKEKIERLAEELKVANQHLKELDQAKSDFVSIVSHQLRTPISGIKGYLAMLSEGDFGSLTDEQRKIINLNLQNIERLISLINIFLDISRIESGKMELVKKPTQLEELIQNVIALLSNKAKDRNLELQFQKPEKKLPEILIDPDKITDIITNLIDNAIKYTDRGGIYISLKSRPKDVVVQIKDTGKGIPKDDVDDLFQKFSRGKRAQILPGGTGLGLYIVKQLTELHGGRVWVKSEGEGKGSVFSFSLPTGV